MKALSIHAPYVFEIITGVKPEEYRTWRPADMPGRVLLCSSAKKYPGYVSGYALAVAEFGRVEPFTAEDGKIMYAWIVTDLQLVKPFKVKGRLHLFDVDDKKIQPHKGNFRSWIEKEYDPLRAW